MTLNWDFTQLQLTAYMLVFCRMAGVILFNPLLSRRNLPTQFAVALSLCLSILVTPAVVGGMRPLHSPFELAGAVSAELLIGFVWGLVFQSFYYMLFMAGDAIDMGMGFSMAKVLDSATNIQMSVSGSVFNILFVMFLFMTNSHISLLRLAISSYNLVGVGGAVLDIKLASFVIDMFLQVVTLVIRLCMPFMAATFTVELTMGLLMKLVPQINVFSIHFQAKVMMGLILLYAFTVPSANFIDTYITAMFKQMESALLALL